MLLNMNSFTMKNSHLCVGLFIVTMIFTLMFENYWCTVIGVCLGISFMIYCEATKWLKQMIKTNKGCFEKVYEITGMHFCSCNKCGVQMSECG